MSSFDDGVQFGLFIGAFLWAIPFLLLGGCIEKGAIGDRANEAAIKADYAHYHPKTGEVVWDKCKELKP